MTNKVIGSCSICGGNVVVPTSWYGVYPPEPTCETCGAVKKRSLPVVEMEQPDRSWVKEFEKLRRHMKIDVWRGFGDWRMK